MKILASGLLLTSVLASSAWASDYPPGYGVERSCKTQGPVEVCVVNQHYGQYPRLSIRYNGSLQNQTGGLKAWIQLNGRSGLYAFENSSDTLSLNEPESYRCFVGPLPDWYQGPYGSCLYEHTGAEVGSMIWEVKPEDAAESDLFFYARNQFGTANAWDIELALVDEAGRWDSLYSANYRFRFE
ncbi:MAG: hypothetical protein EOP07_00950 [Proteobacteria bacterium]|nr:MAG: hypothetical protein EOP07_00950 [Pseudomonadota bacterium]